MDDLKKHIREIPDFPKEGILFYDISTLLQNPLAQTNAPPQNPGKQEKDPNKEKRSGDKE